MTQTPISRTPLRERKCSACPKTFKAHTDEARFCPSCRWKQRVKPAIYVWTPEKDAVMRAQYDRQRGTALRLTLAFGWPASAKWVVNRRATLLGLTRPNSGRPFTPEEDAFLDEHVGVRLASWIAKRLGRTVTSVVMRIKRRKLSRAIRDGYTLRSLADCFGVDEHVLIRWVNVGWLAGRHRYSGKAEPAFNRDAWHFTDADVLRFVRKHPTEFELAKVDQVWFLDLVFGGRIAERVA